MTIYLRGMVGKPAAYLISLAEPLERRYISRKILPSGHGSLVIVLVSCGL